LLEIAVEAGDLGLGLRELRRLDHFPPAPALGDGELMGARHVEELGGAARRERIRAEHQHGLIDDPPVQLRLVLHEVAPLLLLEPGGIAGHPHALVPSRQRPLELAFQLPMIRCRSISPPARYTSRALNTSMLSSAT